MLDADALAFLESEPDWMVLSTLGRDGSAHSVPLGYFVQNSHIYMGCRDRTQKVRNIERDSRVTLLLASSRGSAVNRGLMLRGEADILREPDMLLPLLEQAARKRGHPRAADDPIPPGIAYIRVRPTRVIRWTLEPRKG
ncbi:MAG: pyridoxamine 5'-phosphate oxidase family protein [Armatimonadetes bacterium]|nr:pyridoxamine 5'-phosphate oxidase family protein [Armatimonadota bacterium]